MRARADAPAQADYDPSPWQVLLAERSLPIEAPVKRALRVNAESWSRRFVYPIARVLALASILVFGALRALLPRWLRSYRLLHWVIVKTLQTFALPEANYVVLRHFNIGSQIISFLADNLSTQGFDTHGQYPRTLTDLFPNAFMEHDINLYRFIEGLNLCADTANITAKPLGDIDFSAVRPVELAIDMASPTPPARRWHHFLDLQTAIEMMVPLYVVFLPRDETLRASQSLQFDETVASYAAALLGAERYLPLVCNKMPWVQLSLFNTSTRLLMHGIGSEILYGLLLRLQARQRRLAGHAMP